AITAAPSAGWAGFPRAVNQLLLLQAIEHRVKRSQRETQRALGLAFDSARNFVAVQRTAFEDAKNGQFSGAALNARDDHDKTLLHIGILYIVRRSVNWTEGQGKSSYRVSAVSSNLCGSSRASYSSRGGAGEWLKGVLGFAGNRDAGMEELRENFQANDQT